MAILSQNLNLVNSLARRYLTGSDPQSLDKVAESENQIQELNQLLLQRRANLYSKK